LKRLRSAISIRKDSARFKHLNSQGLGGRTALSAWLASCKHRTRGCALVPGPEIPGTSLANSLTTIAHCETGPLASASSTALRSAPFSTARVLIVDDEAALRRMLSVMLSQSGIFCKAVGSADEALQVLKNERMNAVISDLRMPGVTGMDLLAQVHREYPDLAFLMATGVDDVRIAVQAMKEGADDYLVKPFHLDMVLASLERAFQRKRMQQELDNYRHHLEDMITERTQQLADAVKQLELSYSATLEALGAAIDLRDGATAGHSRRVCWYSVKMATMLGGLESQMKTIAMGAWLHDIGKLAIPDGILLKPGPLTPNERAIMQRHAQIGYELIKDIPFLAEAAEIVLGHHERWDGSGYPRGLRNEGIPQGARIFAVADTVDAMTSDRPYRAALPFQEARDVVEKGAGTQFDARVADAYLSLPNEAWEAMRAEAASGQITSLVTPRHQAGVATPRDSLRTQNPPLPGQPHHTGKYASEGVSCPRK
jgi:response regulator RpfG family c-di-GMP phosphodiesterase